MKSPPVTCSAERQLPQRLTVQPRLHLPQKRPQNLHLLQKHLQNLHPLKKHLQKKTKQNNKTNAKALNLPFRAF